MHVKLSKLQLSVPLVYIACFYSFFYSFLVNLFMSEVCHSRYWLSGYKKGQNHANFEWIFPVKVCQVKQLISYSSQFA